MSERPIAGHVPSFRPGRGTELIGWTATRCVHPSGRKPVLWIYSFQVVALVVDTLVDGSDVFTDRPGGDLTRRFRLYESTQQYWQLNYCCEAMSRYQGIEPL